MTDEVMNHSLANDPHSWELTAALRRFGWEPSGGIAGLFETWRATDGRSDELLVPLDPRRADFRDLLAVARSRLIGWDAPSVGRFFDDLEGSRRAQLDKTSFEKESALPRGMITWLDGEDLFAAAKGALTAAAKATRAARRYHGNASSYLSKQFLEAAIMGQTEVGSFVVTALSPAEQRFHYSKAESDRSEGYDSGLTTVSGRTVVAKLESALTATRNALDEYRQSPHVQVFEEAVRHGVSYELVKALSTISAGSSESAVKISFSSLNAPTREVEVAFTAPDASVLTRAANHLAADRAPEMVQVSGHVTLLDRPQPGESGVVRLRVTSGADVNVVRVRLDANEYESALEAHRQDVQLVVSGSLEREGHYFWLYDASDITLEDDDATTEVDQDGLFGELD